MTSSPEEICLHVCVTCRQAGDPDDKALRPGAILHRALVGALSHPDAPLVRVEAVECLSVCKRPCTIALSGPGRWSYIYGDLNAETSVETILDGLRRYAATSDGLVPWRERPEAFRQGVVARIPPFKANSAA
jgi:predicted metal-binding protein